MNNRQKAKHFKKLYERTLPKNPYPVIYETRSRKHYRVCSMVDEEEICCALQSHDLFKDHIANEILRKLRPIVLDNLKVEKDLFRGKNIYSLDVWL